MKFNKHKISKYSLWIILILTIAHYKSTGSFELSDRIIEKYGITSHSYDVISSTPYNREKESLSAVKTNTIEISNPITYSDTINLDQLADCLAIDPKTGDYYLYYPRSYCVKTYDKDFNFIGTIGTEGEEGTDNDHFGNYVTNTPFGGLKVSNDGRLFVSDPQNQRVQVFNTTDRSYLTTINCSTYMPYGECPFGLDIGIDGSLYVAIYNGPVLIFDKNLTFIDSIFTANNMHTTAIDTKGRIYSGHGDTSYHEIPVYNITTKAMLYGITSVDGTDFYRPVIVRTDYRDNLYVVCDFEHRVQILNKTHGLIGTIGIPNESGNDNDHLNCPLDVAFYKGQVYVLDHNNYRIQIFAIFQTQKSININSNTDFRQQAAGKAWFGNGTVSNPYLIEGYIITAINSKHLVSISNTDVYFQIRECFFNNKYIYDSRGISFANVTNSLITDNTIYNAASDAIWLEQGSTHNNITNNVITYVGSYRSGGDAIGILQSSNNNIFNNTINKYSDGIYLGYTSLNHIYKNKIDDCDRGIRVHAGTNNNSILYNQVSHCEQWAVEMNPSAYGNIVMYNNFIDNLFIESQASDYNGDNIFNYNYWDDWTNPDENFNYIVDLPYHIYGPGNNSDLHPRTTPDFFSFIDHDPIYIDDNEDFVTLGFEGKGTKDNPYIIEGCSINSSETLIEIWHTNVHFKIQKNWLNGITKFFNGIYLYNVTHGTIVNNIILNCSAGIYQEYSKENNLINNHIINSNTGMVHTSTSANLIEGNRVHDCTQTGIYLFNTNYTIISYNAIFNNSNAGIHLASCNNNTMFNNTFNDNDDSGVELDSANSNNIFSNIIQNDGIGMILRSSNKNYFSKNIISRSLYSGIDVGTCASNTFLNNTLFDNNDNGILLVNSINNNLINNSIFQNDRGIHLHNINNQGNIISGNIIKYHNSSGIILDYQAENNQITGNYFIGNNQGGRQAEDNGVNNIFSYNFWDDWITPDENADRIVDNPYPISGNAGNFDNFPLVFGLGHYISQLNIISPKGGEKFLQGDIISIQWSTALCSHGHSITYSIYYSRNSGETWIILASEVVGTEFSWDTYNVDPGTQFLIMVVAECSEGKTITEAIGQTFEIYSDTGITTTTSTSQRETDIPSIPVPVNVPAIIMGLSLLAIFRIIFHSKSKE
ncbi:MAG: right-handed parallel beta-helix repeat-containing protein [Promethearchaeota archaeon]